jgi:dTDP-4-amino-4,6-dideoxygalactose transaminase
MGVKYSISEYIETLKGSGIDVIEDVAQSFQQPKSFKRTPGVTISFFSFGMIKVCSSFYGAVTLINDLELSERMKAI